MKSLTICVIILVLDVDFSFAPECTVCTGNTELKKTKCGHYYCTICLKIFSQCTKCGKNIKNGKDVLNCIVCKSNIELHQVSCSHIYCKTCLPYFTQCQACGKYFTIDCSECLGLKDLLNSSGKIYCKSCKSKASVPSVTEASSSNQSSVPSLTEAPSANQSSVPSVTEAPSSNQLHGADSTSGNQKDNKCVDCNSVDDLLETTWSKPTDSCHHKVCYSCYLKNEKNKTKKCPGCRFILLGYKLGKP
ncbi:uncharacterized protein LOC126897464 isoform X3 [Daktulosphaira vitifoliae]|uniref:uncharacterized protein LOC126897464 isoform X3 n=1 Tax=Daktulosphaira vitifoliae TaxID=58002 RepID=UPI0021AA4B9B|nr:uncharacterized protein LOC126897464 isoform X3 [Daktulosphaira vitifoliae]